MSRRPLVRRYQPRFSVRGIYVFQKQKEMTLDHVSLHTVKGHFCSLLISNIFCYPLFRSLPFAVPQQPWNTFFFFSLMRIPLVFVCFCHRWKAKRELLFEACTDPRPEYKLLNITHKSILCVTPPWFFYRFGPFGNFRLPLFEVVKLNLPLECTFLSSPIV